MINWFKRLFKKEPEKLTEEFYPIYLRTNETGIELIKDFEKFEPKAYKCPADKWTIGYGFTEGVKEGDKMTKEEADKRLKLEILKREKEIREVVLTDLTDNEFSALVSFVYNVGIGKFQNSTLLKKINSKAPKSEIAQQFLRWTKVGKKELAGLKRRRIAESQLFLT